MHRDRIHSALLDWFATHARPLPWREPTCSAWGVLVSEVMLQQTPVVRVEPVWREWMDRWPTPAALAGVPDGELVRAWGRLGYPRRALRLGQAARAITERHGGEVPTDTEALLALPGIGSYTAAAIRAFAFGERDTVLDTNVRRVLGRLDAGLRLPPPTLTTAERQRATEWLPNDPDCYPAAGTAHELETTHEQVGAHQRPSARWNAAVMELGALVCQAAAPNCDACPLAAWCAFHSAGHPPDAFAARRRTQAWAGTDRQLRGRILALLRERGTVATATLTAALTTTPAATPAEKEQASQLERCLASLLADGLIAAEPSGFALPGLGGTDRDPRTM